MRISSTLDRSRVWLAQTPQVFQAEILRRAHDQATADGFYGTDESSLVERLGIPVEIVPSDPGNRKITTPEDIDWAGAQLRR